MGDGKENDLEKTVAICDLSEVQEKWEAVLQRVKPQNHSVEALLRSTRPTAVQGRSIVIEVFYEFHKGRLETEKCRVIVENSLRDILGKKELIVDYILGDRQKRMEPKIGKMESGDNELVQAAEEIFRK